MSDTNPDNVARTESSRFPFVTVGAALGVLFAFLFLMWFVTTGKNWLDEPKADAAQSDPPADAAAKLDEVNARNEAALNGVGARMSRAEARGKLLANLKGLKDAMPFPLPEPEKKDDPKADPKKEKP